jgi:hypothetical protein
VGVLVAFVVYGSVLISHQRLLLKEVGHGALVALGADLKPRFVRRPGRVCPGSLLAVGLGVVYGPQ